VPIKITAQSTESAAAAPRLRAALARIAAIPEGQGLVDALDRQDYRLHLMPLDTPAGLLPDMRTVLVQDSLSEDDMVVFLPHEAFHAEQFANCPDLAAFHTYVVMAEQGSNPPPAGTITVPRPHDFVWGMNMMELAAYGVQTDFVFQLAERSGDDAPLARFYTRMKPLADTYAAVRDSNTLAELSGGGRCFLRADAGDIISPDFRRDYATAAAGYFWFWATKDCEGTLMGLHYNDHLVDSANENSRARVSPLFNAMAAGQTRVAFRKWDAADVLRLGRGYPVNPLNVPGFEDVTTPPYRNRMTRECAQRLRTVERALSR
jgi:hypothetical protein